MNKKWHVNSFQIFEYGFKRELSEKILKVSKESNMAIYIILLVANSFMLKKNNIGSSKILGIPPLGTKNRDYTMMPLENMANFKMNFKESLGLLKSEISRLYSLEDLERNKHLLLFEDRQIDCLISLDSLHDSKLFRNEDCDLNISFKIIQRQINFKIRANTQKYTKEEIHLFAQNTGKFLELVLNNPNSSLNELSEKIEKENEQVIAFEEQEICLEGETGLYLASSAQKRMYTLMKFDSENIAYNIPCMMGIEGALSREKVFEVLNSLIQRHETLRTSFRQIGGSVYQKIENQVDFNLEWIKSEQSDKNKILEEFIRPFDMSKAPLIRVRVVEKRDNQYLILFDMHHIISDGTSFGILTKEFKALYSSGELSPLKYQYKDYSAWQRQLMNNGEMQNKENYWINKLSGQLPVLELVTDFKRPNVRSFDGEKVVFKINEETLSRLNLIAQQNNMTLFMVLFSAYSILLYKYTNQQDLLVGVPIAGRSENKFQNIIGMFVNTLILRVFPNGEKTINEFMNEVKVEALCSYENQEYQFDDLLGRLKITRDISRNPIFDTMFVFQNMEFEELEIEGIKIKFSDNENLGSKFDISMICMEREGELQITIEYATSLFKESTMKRLCSHYKKILEHISLNQHLKISEIDTVEDDEKEVLLKQFNETEKSFCDNRNVWEIFRESSQKYQHRIAVVEGGKVLKFGELYEKVIGLSNKLKRNGIGRGSIVGVMMPDSIEMVISAYAILACGAGFLPIDPQLSKNRIEFMIQDAKANWVLIKTDSGIPVIEDCNLLEICVDDTYEIDIETFKAEIQDDDLAYVIYTSGTTGIPKGVMVDHSALKNLCQWSKEYYGIGIEDKAVKYVGFGFDVTIFELFTYLVVGASLHILTDEVKFDMRKLNDYFNENGISIAFLPTQICEQFMDEDNHSLRVLQTGGDKLKKTPSATNYTVVNNYGPTENAVISTAYCVESREYRNIPIGKPITNTKAYILDEHLKLKPIGIVGELYLSGSNLAMGYLNREELMKERFISNPYEPGKMMYKSGDLARWLDDGNIEFFGRADRQVKIRGYRIELGEIENFIESQVEVKACVVMAVERNDFKDICAYVVLEENVNISQFELILKERIKNELPYYMVPSLFIQIESIPFTPNGKVDYNALPKPEMQISKTLIDPINAIELKLLKLFKETLGIDTISTDDKFFDLGGHSLNGIKLISDIYKEFGKDVGLNVLFRCSTIQELGKYLSELEEALYPEITIVPTHEHYPVSAAQKRMYIVNQFDQSGKAYNVSTVVEVQGHLEKDRLEESINKMIERHAIFRTTYHIKGNEVVQVVTPESFIKIDDEKIEQSKLKEIVRQFIKPFDLEQGPMLRVKLCETDEDRQYLILDTHHILMDGMSMAIFIKELSSLYNNETLEELHIQYKDFSVWHNELLRSEKVRTQKEFWMKNFETGIQRLNLGSSNDCVGLGRTRVLKSRLTRDEMKHLKEISKEVDCTSFMLFLGIFKLFLKKQSGKNDITVGSPISGRHYKGVETLIGMFVNTVVFRTTLEDEHSLKSFFRELRDNVLQVFENQDYPFDQLVECLNGETNTSKNPIFDVMFTYQNINSSQFKETDLGFKDYEYEYGNSKFDMILGISESEEEIGINMAFDDSKFDQLSMAQMLSDYEELISKVLGGLEQKVKHMVY